MERPLEQKRSQAEPLTPVEGDSVLQRWRRLQTLVDTLGRADGTEATVAALLTQVLPASGAQVAVLALLDAQGREFTVRRIPEGPLPATAPGEASAELRCGEPLFFAAPPRPSALPTLGILWWELLGSPGAAAILPLRSGARVLGSLGLGFGAPRDFDEAERAFLLLTAHECAQALERARLHESERDFRAMFELASSGKVQADPVTWRFVRVNRKFCEITGYSEAELLTRTFLDITHPEDHGLSAGNFQHALDHGEDGWQSEKRYLRKDGALRWVIVTGSVTRDAAGRPLRSIAVIHDITSRKLAELALQEADRRKDEFLAMLGHELRNPLMPIRNALALLQHTGPGVAPEVQARAHQIIDRQVRHMVRLVDDLLDVSRIERGKIELRRQRIDVLETVHQAIESCQYLVRARQHELVLDLPEGPLAIEADPTRLEQVICNLLNNAAKYTEPRGRIVVRMRREGEEVVLQVIDNGIGLSPESRGRIFELFVQADHSLARSEGGLGLGLTLVRQLVEMHGGTVAVFSAGPGRGSEFVVRLPIGPIQAAPPEPDTAASPAGGPGRPGRHVLLIDDNEDIRSTLGALLELTGHQVSLACDGHEGLERLVHERPDVALVDVGLPGIDGYELARRARAAVGSAVVLIAVTGYGQDEDRRQALAAGFDLHMTKPVNPDHLLRALSRLPSAPPPQGEPA
ncbi:MAG TPA: ATP-binding protein [Polyangia bacterium]|jgi:PAS domain S-box-containing protein|nr:ATP-binding protein [Polyangia bacterium]